MENRSERDLRYLQLCFIGKIIAGFTHEIKNHVAIVKESAGLMGDILKFGKKGESDPQQFLEIINSVEEQIERTLELFAHLNRFAHRMDRPRVSFNVNESLEDLISLISRFARQRKISLEKDFQSDLPSINNDPALLQLLVFCVVEDAMTRLDKTGKIIFRTSAADGKIRIGIAPQGNLIEPERQVCSNEDKEYVIKLLNGTLAEDKKEALITLVSMS